MSAKSSGADPSMLCVPLGYAGRNCSLPILPPLLKKSRLIHSGIHRDIEKSDHHLFPALFSESNLRFGIRIAWIVGRVVKITGARQSRAGGKRQWLRQAIVQLPVEVVVTNS